LDRILDATYGIWNDGLSPAAYARWWDAQLRTTWGRRSLRRFALVDGDRVLASAKQYGLSAIVDGVARQIAGIGAVFTQPDARGQGHARALIAAMLGQAARERA